MNTVLDSPLSVQQHLLKSPMSPPSRLEINQIGASDSAMNGTHLSGTMTPPSSRASRSGQVSFNDEKNGQGNDLTPLSHRHHIRLSPMGSPHYLHNHSNDGSQNSNFPGNVGSNHRFTTMTPMSLSSPFLATPTMASLTADSPHRPQRQDILSNQHQLHNKKSSIDIDNDNTCTSQHLNLTNGTMLYDPLRLDSMIHTKSLPSFNFDEIMDDHDFSTNLPPRSTSTAAAAALPM